MISLSRSAIIAWMLLSLTGCGQSEATKAAEADRKAGRQRFKEAVAAVKVRTEGSTYSEFRKAQLDLKTSFEANRSHLEDIQEQFAELSGVMVACDYLWNHSIHYPNVGLDPKLETDLEAMVTITPRVRNKVDFTKEQQDKDPDFHAGNYAKRGLTQINASCNTILELLSEHN